MKDLINLVAAHARACYLRLAQLDVELTEVRKMERERQGEYRRLQQQALACRTMLVVIRDDLPAGEGRDALDQLIDRLDRPGEPAEDQDPPWDDDDLLEVPDDHWPAWEAPNRYPGNKEDFRLR